MDAGCGECQRVENVDAENTHRRDMKPNRVDRRYLLDLMHGRSRMTIDPRIPSVPGRSMYVGFSPTRQILLAPSAKRREVSGESNEG